MAALSPARQRSLQLIFAAAILLGLVLAWYIYQQGQSTLNGLNQLTEESLPRYQQIDQLTALLSDYERLTYQYHTDQQSGTRERDLPDGQQKILAMVSEVSAIAGSEDVIPLLQTRIDRIFVMGKRVIAEVDDPATDWDRVREHLASLTQERAAAWRDLENLKALTGQYVVANRQAIYTSVDRVNYTVIGFGVLVLCGSLLVGRAIRRYLTSSAGMARLALYPQRNPNPVFSLDEQRSITFLNPAGHMQLAKCSENKQRILDMMPVDFDRYLAEAQQSESGSIEFEFTLDHAVFFAYLHWHEDQRQWDVHLRDITETRRAEERLMHQAFHDPETGMPNSYQLAERLQARVGDKHMFLFGVIRIHGLSHVRSMEGEMEVVALKQELAEVLRGLVEKRPEAEAFQLNDAEFAVIACQECGQDDALELVRDIRREAVNTRFNKEINLRLDFGFAAYPANGENMETLLRNARIMLNQEQDIPTEFQVLVYSEEMRQKLEREKYLTEGMHRALEDNTFALYFQPQQRLHDRVIVGSEALLRWQYEGNWVSPGEFIPLAERSELILQIDQWVLESAFKASSVLLESGLPTQVIAVNISPRQFSQLDFLATLNQLSESYAVAPSCIGLEITEGVMIDNMADSMTAMLNLKQSGFHLALDDFGTGYSSLSYLHNFPISKLKIDQSFIRHFLEDASLQAIVGSIVELGKNLGMKVIAEGVETEAEMLRLSTMGCHEIQGYYLSKPLPFEAYLALLKASSQVAREPGASNSCS